MKLEALSPLDGRYASAAEPVRRLLSEEALIVARSKIELAWLEQLLSIKMVCAQFSKPAKKAPKTLSMLASLKHEQIVPGIRKIEKTTRHDVKAVELWLAKQLADAGLGDLAPLLHFGLTSWDVNNLAYGLMLSDARDKALVPAVDAVIGHLSDLARTLADTPLLGRTHAQPASPTTMGKEMAIYAHRLQRQRDKLAKHIFDGKCNGAVGNYNALATAFPAVDWPSISKRFVEKLGLNFISHTTQIEPYDGMVEFFDTLARSNRILRDLAQDASIYIGAGHLRMPVVAKETGSSTMPHKVNPIDFENGEGNIAVSNCLLSMFAEQLQQSRLQRDLSDSTILRNIGSALGHAIVALNSIARGLATLEGNPASMQLELEGNWQVLAEAIQTVLRSQGDTQAYEKVKHAVRGINTLDQEGYRKVAAKLVPEGAALERLLNLTPTSYIGLAAKLARRTPGKKQKN